MDRAAHTALEHSCAVRAQAALCLGQWGVYRAPRDRENTRGWKTIEACSKYWEERVVGVVRAKRRRKGKRGKKKVRYEWAWADEGESESDEDEEESEEEDSEVDSEEVSDHTISGTFVFKY